MVDLPTPPLDEAKVMIMTSLAGRSPEFRVVRKTVNTGIQPTEFIWPVQRFAKPGPERAQLSRSATKLGAISQAFRKPMP